MGNSLFTFSSKPFLSRRDRESGFTLIELLVVILIIGILAAIAVPMFLNQRKSAVDAQVTSDVTNAAKQVETWITMNGGATAKPLLDDGPIAEIVTSEGTRLSIHGNSFHYGVFALHDGGDKSAPNPVDGGGIFYDSLAGGLIDPADIPEEPLYHPEIEVTIDKY